MASSIEQPKKVNGGSIAAEAAIELQSVSKRYGTTEALSDCSLIIRHGEFVSLLGPSGCGKTTMLRIIGGFAHQDAGVVRIQGKVVDGLPPNKRAVNTVFQNYALFPNRTVMQNVLFPLEVAKVPKAERRDRAAEMLTMVRLEGFENRSVDNLSGGQAQRVALARALVGRPEVLLLDEPLAALDLKLRKAMQTELRRIHDEVRTTFVYVTHDQGEAMAMSDRIVLMNLGHILQVADPRTIYDQPGSVFASDFLGEANHLEGTVTDRSADVVTVQVGHLRVAATGDATLRAGSRVTVSIRPERIRVSLHADANANSQLHGVLKRTVFLGHVVRCVVELETGAMLTVEAGRGQAERWDPGERVVLGWDVADALALHDGPPENDVS